MLSISNLIIKAKLFYDHPYVSHYTQILQYMSQRKFSKDVSNYSYHKTHQTNTSPAIKNTSKSPLSNSKCTNHQPNKLNVSYGELQIVLENIQTIRQKAAAQVNQLNEDNQNLRQQITALKSTIQELELKLKAQNEFGESVQHKWRRKFEQSQQQKSKKQQSLEQKNNRIKNYEEKNKQLEISVIKQKEKTSKFNRQLQQLKKKWSWAFTILAGDEDKAEELVWRVKNTNYNLVEIIQTHSKMLTVVEAKNERIQGLNEDLKQARQNIKQTAKLLQKSIGQINIANTKLSAAEKQSKEIYQKIRNMEEITREAQNRLNRQLILAKNEINRLEFLIRELEEKVVFLSNQMTQSQELILQQNKKQEYLNLISEICEESEDYGKVLQRITYLQKFRRQHYLNVQKIQYLCKMLDN